MEPEKHESDLTPKERRRKRLDTIRSLHGRKKAEYLWTYYKSWLFIFLLAAAGIFVAAYSYRNRRTSVILSIAVEDVDYNTGEQAKELKRDLVYALGNGEGRETVALDTSVRSGDESAMAMKRMVIVGTGDTDLFLCGEETYEGYLREGAFVDWKEALGERYGEYEMYLRNGRLDLSESERWQSYGLTSYAPVYVGVLQGTDKAEELCGFLAFFF